MTARKPGAGPGPLDRVLSLWAARGGSLVANEFLYLGPDRIDGVVIHVYKHRRSRRCLNLDEAGHAYVFVPSGEGEQLSGPRYRLLASLDSAIVRLGRDAAMGLALRDLEFAPIPAELDC